MRTIVSAFLMLALLAVPVCAKDSTYSDVAFPQWAKDIRRTEIITFGSLPFVTLWTTVGYSLAVKGEFHSPLDKSSSGFTTGDQARIIGIAAATSIGLGLFDLAFTLISRKIKAKKRRDTSADRVQVIPFSAEWQEQGVPQSPPAYLQGGLESALF